MIKSYNVLLSIVKESNRLFTDKKPNFETFNWISGVCEYTDWHLPESALSSISLSRCSISSFNFILFPDDMLHRSAFGVPPSSLQDMGFKVIFPLVHHLCSFHFGRNLLKRLYFTDYTPRI